MTTSFPALVTPNPSIHTIPTTPPTPQSALGVINQATGISDGVAGQVSTALTGSGGMGNPFGALAAFGQAALSAIGNIAEMLINLGVDAIEGVTDIIKDAIQGVANIFDAIFSAFTGGLFGGGASQEQALGALTATQDTIEATAKAVQAMQSQDSANSNGGVSVWLDFTDDADSLTLADFIQANTRPSASSIGISGGRAVQIVTGANNALTQALYTPKPTNTDYQIVSAIYGSAPSSSGYVTLIGRSNASLTTYVYAVIDYFQCLIVNVVSGTETTVATLNLSPQQFYAGAAYDFQCGIEGSPNTYEVKINGATLLSWVDTANVTNVGEDYRYCGFGLGQNTGASAKCAAWGFTDNAPGVLIGDMFRAYSTNGTAIQITPATAPQLAPASFYDSVEFASDNYTYDPTTNSLTIAKGGPYIVEVSTQWAPSVNVNVTYFGPAIFKNGSLYKQGNTPGQATPNQSTNPEPFFSIASETFVVQIDPGDFIQPGWFSYSTPDTDNTLIQGDPAAELAIFSCALLNQG